MFKMSIFTDNRVTRNYTWRLFICSIILTLSSANYAFDNQGFSQTQAMDPFIRRFGDCTKAGKCSLPSNFLSYSNAFPFLLLIVGIAAGSTISARFGRRATVFCMCCWAIMCVPIIVTAKTRSQFLAGRCLNSVYIGMEMSVIPIFQSEIVPAAVRGLAVASYQMSFSIGGFVISGICHRTAMIPNDWSWRIPFLAYLFVPTVVGSLIWFQPESPRWLVMNNKIPQAREVLTKFRKPGVDIEHELSQIMVAVELERNRRKGSFADCFKGIELRRTLIVFGVNFFLQSTGQAFTSLYGTIIVKQLNSINPFTYTLINSALGMVMYLVNLVINDHVGRRPLMIASAAWQSTFMFIIAGLGTQQTATSVPINRALVACITLFSMGFGFGWAPCSYLVSAEVPSLTLRDKTTRMGFIVGIATQFVVAFSLPYMIYAPGQLGMKVGFIFGPIAVLATIWAMIFLPECKGLTLEQIDILFEEKISAWRTHRWGLEHKTIDIAASAEGRIVGAEEEKRGTDIQVEYSDSKEKL